MAKVIELNYSSTNTYLIEGSIGTILFDTGWAGTFTSFCGLMGKLSRKVQDIDYILISHFHPDHMGIAQEIANLKPVIVVMEVQQPFIHASDDIFTKDKQTTFYPIEDGKVKVVACRESRQFLQKLGIAGEILHTPGHSEDSITLCLDDGKMFVGDLNPLYELEMHRGTEIERSWKKLLKLKADTIYYGHAKTAVIAHKEGKAKGQKNTQLHTLVSRIIKYIDKGYPVEKIEKKTGADRMFIEDVNRMYLTHQNVGVQGILDRIEIKGK